MIRKLRKLIHTRQFVITICVVSLCCHVVMLIMTQGLKIQTRYVISEIEVTHTIKTNHRKVGASKVQQIREDTTIVSKTQKERLLFDCKDIESLKKTSRLIREANEHGNKAIYAITNTRNERFVLKVSEVRNASDTTDWFGYYAGLKEIKNLKLLENVGFKGFPLLRGTCVTNTSVSYVVDYVIDSRPMCSGNGTDFKCSIGQEVLEAIQNSEDAALSAMIWLKKVTCFFRQFLQYFIFMEDISGSNLFFSPSTFNITLVDADSLIFYSNVSLLSRMSCRKDGDCNKPSGSLWPWHSLNRKIYHQCGEMQGRCHRNICSGFDANLHSCGVGYWLLMLLRKVVPASNYKDYKQIRECLTKPYPSQRCSMTYACDRATELLQSFQSLQTKTNST